MKEVEMQVDIRHVNLQASEALRDHADRCIGRALGPFRVHVQHVELRIQDVNGPRGGVDKRCSVAVQLDDTQRNVVVKSECADAYAAVQEACGRLGRAVSRALSRRRQLDRYLEASEIVERPAEPRDEAREALR